MQEILRHVRYSEGGWGLNFLTFAFGAVISGLLFSFQVPFIAANLGIEPDPFNLQQKCRNGNTLLAGSSGTTFTYSFHPWGGVKFDSSDRAILTKRDDYFRTLLWGTNEYPLSKAETLPAIAKSEMRMTGAASRPKVQFLRIRNPNWMTTF